MLKDEERRIVFEAACIYKGPNAWGWLDNARLTLQQTLTCPEYG